MKKINLILIGGFLGAGKTTLLVQAARSFLGQGKRVGLITNDQGANLVDTALLKQQGFGVREVSGGCFCCRFDDFISAADRIIDEFKPDVILGEPVGSCTDLSATVLQPLKKLHSEVFQLAPFSVLVDPLRLSGSLKAKSPGFLPESSLHIFRTQIEEADLIVVNKSDTLSAKQSAEMKELLNWEFPDIPIVFLSALKGDNLKPWLEFVLSGKIVPGNRIARVDYDTYAEEEAALGWLNASFQLHPGRPVDASALCRAYLGSIRDELRSVNAQIVHVKLFLREDNEFLAANLVSNKADVTVRGNLKNISNDANLILNARVRIGPPDLSFIVKKCIKSVTEDQAKVVTNYLESFKPARPKPTHRFDATTK